MNCDEIEKIIKKKIKFFTKEKYFNHFSKILTESSSDIFKIKSNKILTNRLDNLESNNLKKYENSKKMSLWGVVMKIILFSNENNYYDIDLICYNYLLRLCQVIIKQLLSISIKLKSNLSFCVKIYLKLCEEKIIGKPLIPKKKLSGKKEFKSVLLRRLTTISKIPIIRSTIKKDELKLLMENKKQKKKLKKLKFKSINDKSNKNNSNTFLYCNSYTRLFIGDTDEASVKERYLSNIIIKNEQRLNIHGTYIDLSGGYLKQLYNKIAKQNQMQESTPEPENRNKKLIEIQKAFKKDYRKIESLKKNIQDKSQNININIDNNTERNRKKSIPKFFYPSIINFNNIKHIDNSNLLSIGKENTKIINKNIKKNVSTTFKLTKNLKKNNLDKNIFLINKKKNIINKDNSFGNSFVYKSKYLSSGNSLNNSVSKKKKKKNTNSKDKNIFNKINYSGKNLIKKKLNFNSTNRNSNNNYSNMGDKIHSSKNYLDKTDFFFYDI